MIKRRGWSSFSNHLPQWPGHVKPGAALLLLEAWPISAYTPALSGEAEANREHLELYKRDDFPFVSPGKNLPENLT